MLGGVAPADFLELLRVKIENLDVKSAKSDVIRFVPDPSVLDIWSVDYFRQLSEHIRFT